MQVAPLHLQIRIVYCLLLQLRQIAPDILHLRLLLHHHSHALFCLHLAQCSKTSHHNPVCRQMGLELDRKRLDRTQVVANQNRKRERIKQRLKKVLWSHLPARFALHFYVHLGIVQSWPIPTWWDQTEKLHAAQLLSLYFPRNWCLTFRKKG